MRFSAQGGLIAGLALACATAAAGERWEVQLFHDEDKSSLILNDIAFPTPTRGLAVGALVQRGDPKPIALVTSDGGAHWTYVKAPDFGSSVFCLDETACWMTGRRGVWFSTETGRDWRRILGKRGIQRVYFLDRDRGWAVGTEKTLLETRDGGKHWSAMPVKSEVKSSQERTVFHAISFAGLYGIIAGRSEPRELRPQVPLWMDHEAPLRREVPALTVILQTLDLGKTWRVDSSSVFGRITRVQTTKTGLGLALLEFERYFQYPSEVLLMDMVNGKGSIALRRPDFAVTDLALLEKGPAIAAGFEPPGKLPQSPVPGKLRVMKSADLTNWAEMEVDYRAVAHRVSIAAAGADHVWLATDTGMILRLVRE